MLSDFFEKARDQFSQKWKRLSSSDTFSSLNSASVMSEDKTGTSPIQKVLRVGTALLLVLGLGYGISTQFAGTINDSLTLDIKQPNGGSYAVETAAAIMERELQSGWHPSDMLNPARFRTDLPAYQMGVKASLERLAMALTDNIGRYGSSSEKDKDLAKARSDLQFDESSFSVFNQNSSVVHYQNAVEHLRAYNDRLGQGQATFDSRIDNLTSLLWDISRDMGSQVDALYNKADKSGFFSLSSRHDYFFTKGLLNGNCLLMKGLEKDFKKVLDEQSSTELYDKATDKVCEASLPTPPFVLNDTPTGILGSHLRLLAGETSTAQNKIQSFLRAMTATPGR